MSSGPEGTQEPTNETSSTGLDPNLAGLLCYLLSFVTGIVFLLVEKENRGIAHQRSRD
jgi:hypothetical protein